MDRVPQRNWWARRSPDLCSQQWKGRSPSEWSSLQERLWSGWEGDHHISVSDNKRENTQGITFLWPYFTRHRQMCVPSTVWSPALTSRTLLQPSSSNTFCLKCIWKNSLASWIFSSVMTRPDDGDKRQSKKASRGGHPINPTDKHIPATAEQDYLSYSILNKKN